ncbi:HlyD family secretion protein [Roseococcus sp. SDR]|uniref:HlyD family secretion protein n=1 Tax=Roseococcus sp. SDR TaxID=2835532 RepID=UPI001BCC406B|nr:HlyD family secretion protein [Roseococcus sp. SDR]MBS7792605.1 HlyD family secretion protein [Roseococcus sp. SDR]MBV1847919.1 HlyD family secretion protein [Roseococcus sp. SDR]
MDIGPADRGTRDSVGQVRGRTLRQRARLAGASLALLVALGFGARWLHFQFTHVVLDDARVASDMVILASRVPGWVQALPVTAGDSLREGDLLVQIDAREATLAVEELNARLAGIAARRGELQARLTLVDRQSESQHAAAQARLDAARTTLPAAEAERDFAEAELGRAERLIQTGAGTRQRFEMLNAALHAARSRAIAAAAEIRNAEALMALAQAAREEMQVITRQLEALGPQERELTAARDRAALDVADRTIRMPFDGVVDRIFMDPGEYVLAGQRIIMVHSPAQIRIEANVKETDVRHFRPGVPVTVTVDAWPGQVFTGVVDRMVEAATSEFALLPSANPSGNFTRITQRLPLRVRLDPPPPPGLLRPGMLVRVTGEARG